MNIEQGTCSILFSKTCIPMAELAVRDWHSSMNHPDWVLVDVKLK